MPISLAVTIITKALCILIDVIVLFLNPLIIDVIYNDRTIRQQPSGVYITNLAIADMFVAGTNLMNMIFHFMDLTRIVPICITLYGFFSLSMINASLFFMFCNSIDRFVFIKMSFQYHAIMNRNCVRGLVIAVWIVSLSMPFFPYIFIDHAWEYKTCVELFHSEAYRGFHFFLAAIFVVTILVTAIMFVSVFRVVRRSRRLRHLPMRTFSSETTMSSASTWLSLQNTDESPVSSVHKLIPYSFEPTTFSLLKTSANTKENSPDSSRIPTITNENEELENFVFEAHMFTLNESEANSSKDMVLANSSSANKKHSPANEDLQAEDEKQEHIVRPIMSNNDIKMEMLKAQIKPSTSRLEDDRTQSRVEIVTNKPAARKTKSETLDYDRSNRKKKSCVRKAMDRTNEMTHFWCTEPTMPEVSYIPNLMPDSIYIYQQSPDQPHCPISVNNSDLTNGLAHSEMPRINCVHFNGKYSIFIESPSLVSQINRSIAECFNDNSAVARFTETQESVEEGLQSAIGQLAACCHQTSNQQNCRETQTATRPNSIDLLDRCHHKKESQTSPAKTETPNYLRRPARFSFSESTAALKKKGSSLSGSTSPSTPFGETAYSGRDIRTLKILFLMFCVYLFLWFPTFFVHVLRTLNSEVSLEVVVICYTIGVSNSVVNFFVYPMKIPRLKLVFKQLLQKSFKGVKKKLKSIFPMVNVRQANLG